MLIVTQGGGYYKGFTLIELLAIIVILAIIAVITVPIILNIINDAEKNSAMDSAHGYKDALQKYYATKSIQNPESELPSGYIDISKLASDFTVSGEAPSEGWVKLKKGIVDKFSLKYKDYVVTMDNDKNVVSEKKEQVYPHVTNEYQEVEYLESTGTQYIYTGVIGESKWEITNQYITPSVTSQILIGCGPNSGQWFGQYNEKYAIGSSYVYNIPSQTKKDILIDFTSNSVSSTIEGETKNRSGSLNNNSYYLFGGLSSSSGNFYSYTRVYKANTFQDDELVRQFVPVIRKSDNKPRMLDLANLSNNLFDSSTLVNNTHLNLTTGIPCEYNNRTGSMTAIDVSNLNNVTLTYNMSKSGNFMYSLFKDGVLLSRTTGNVSGKTIDVSEADELYLAWYGSGTITTNDLTEIMLNEGTTALPYEPYGYKFYTNAGTDEFITGPEI